MTIICHDNMYFSSVQFSHSVVSDSLQPYGLQHTKVPCPSPIPRAYSNPCPLSWWWHPTISSSVIPSPPAFNLSQHQGLFRWISSAHQLAKVLEFQPQHQFFHEYSGLISFRIDLLNLFAVQGTLKSLLQHHSSKASILQCFFLGSKITADGDCSHEIKTHLLLGRKVMTNPDSILKTETLFCWQWSV